MLEEADKRFGWWEHARVVIKNHFLLPLDNPEPNFRERMEQVPEVRGDPG